MKTIAIIQARMASSRLPGKVLQDLGGRPALSWVVERTRRAQRVDQVIVATTTDPNDSPIVNLCQQNGYAYSRGSQHDVLDRYYQAARDHSADIVVRITADCPVIDPGVIDQTIDAFFTSPGEDTPNSAAAGNATGVQPLPWDFAANRLPPPWGRTFPIGLDTEVTTFANLEVAWQEASAPHQREHVMPFFYEQPERFRIFLLNYHEDYGRLRWTLDTPEDLKALRQIISLFPGRDDFTWLEVLHQVQHHPELSRINAQVHHKDYRDYDHRQENKRSAK